MDSLRPRDMGELNEMLADTRAQRMPKSLQQFFEKKVACESECLQRVRERMEYEVGLLQKDAACFGTTGNVEDMLHCRT